MMDITGKVVLKTKVDAEEYATNNYEKKKGMFFYRIVDWKGKTIKGKLVFK